MRPIWRHKFRRLLNTSPLIPNLLDHDVLQNLIKLAESARERGDIASAGDILDILALKFDDAIDEKCPDTTRPWAMTHIIKLESKLCLPFSTSLLRHSMQLLRTEVKNGIGVHRGVHFSQWAVTNVIFPEFQDYLSCGRFSEADQLLSELMLLLQKVYGRKTSILGFFMTAHCQALRNTDQQSMAKEAEQRLKQLNKKLDARPREALDFTFPTLRPAVDIWDQGRWHAHFREYHLAAAKLQQAFEDKDQLYLSELEEIAKEWAEIEIGQFNEPEKAMQIACDLVTRVQKERTSITGAFPWAEQDIWQPIIEKWILSGRHSLALSWLNKIRPILEFERDPYDRTVAKFTVLTQRCLEGQDDSAVKGEVDDLVARQNARQKILREFRDLWDLAYKCLRQREFQQALEYFEKSEAVAQGEDAFPDLTNRSLSSSRHHRQVAACYLGLKRWEEAEARLVIASSLLPAPKGGFTYVLQNVFILELKMELALGKEEFTRVNRLAMTLIVELAQVHSIERCYSSVMVALNQSRWAINALLEHKYYGQVFEQCIHLLETLERHFPEGLNEDWIVRLLERISRETPDDVIAEQFRLRIEDLRR